MQMGMIGLGRMGSGMVQRLLADGHQCVVYDQDEKAAAKLVGAGATTADSLESLITSLASPRAIWIMLPAGDSVIDGGNSNFEDDRRRAVALATGKINYVDVGTSGGVWGHERGFCLMIGGDKKVVQQLDPLFQSLAPATDKGYLHCGGHGAGHFVKMVHNGIEYGLMAAYAEGFAVLDKAAQTDTVPVLDVDSGEVTAVWWGPGCSIWRQSPCMKIRH